jgi:hypothetical protein
MDSILVELGQLRAAIGHAHLTVVAIAAARCAVAGTLVPLITNAGTLQTREPSRFARATRGTDLSLQARCFLPDTLWMTEKRGFQWTTVQKTNCKAP